MVKSILLTACRHSVFYREGYFHDIFCLFCLQKVTNDDVLLNSPSATSQGMPRCECRPRRVPRNPRRASAPSALRTATAKVPGSVVSSSVATASPTTPLMPETATGGIALNPNIEAMMAMLAMLCWPVKRETK